MLKNLELPKSHLTAYHGNNSTLIQFILFEMMRAFHESDDIETLLSEITLTPKKKISRKDREHLDSLTASITRLGGYPQKYMRIFTWNLNDATLSKLKNYCSLFAKNLHPNDPYATPLQRNADRAWNHCLESLERINEVQQLPSHEIPDLSKLKTSLKKMINRKRQLARTVKNILPRFCDDENVLFFILRHHEPLDRIFASGFVANLFQKMFPNGKEEAEQFLTKKYSSRGFKKLLPVISKKISFIDTALV